MQDDGSKANVDHLGLRLRVLLVGCTIGWLILLWDVARRQKAFTDQAATVPDTFTSDYTDGINGCSAAG